MKLPAMTISWAASKDNPFDGYVIATLEDGTVFDSRVVRKSAAYREDHSRGIVDVLLAVWHANGKQ